MSGHRVYIIDDEVEAINYLELILKESFPDLKIIGKSTDSAEGIKGIFRLHPDLLFLDIQIDENNGFDIVEKLSQEDHLPWVIFVTAFEQYAIEAFRANALDYLLKPVSKEELQRAVNKFMNQKKKLNGQHLNMDRLKGFGKIKFNTSTGSFFLKPEEIVYCESDGNYSNIFTTGGAQKMVSKNIGALHKELLGDHFVRVSRFSIINPDYLVEVNSREKICILNNGMSEIRLNCNGKYMRGL